MENSMQSKEIETIRAYIERSKKTLQEAKYNLDGYNLLTAQNRIYYACFYITKSLSLLDNFITSKHKVLLDWFNKKYVHDEKVFSKELFEIYKRAFYNRTDADYSIAVTFTKDEVTENYDDVKSFIDTIEKYISERIENNG